MLRPINNIVVGVAALNADPVLKPALDLAHRLGAPLHVVHAFDIPAYTLLTYSRYGMREQQVVDWYRGERQAQLERQVQALAGNQQVVCRTICGSGSQVLCDTVTETQADLVIVGATRQGPVMRHVLGSTADRVIRSSAAPVLVLRAPAEIAVRRVLLTTDLSALSTDVFDRSIQLVDRLVGADEPELRCLMVTWYDIGLPPPLRRETLEEVARTDLERFVAERSSTRSVESRLRIGDPAKEIVAEASDFMADLLVVGTRGHPNVSRYILGSVAASVLRSAVCNVLVIPASAVAREDGDAAPVSPSRAD